MNFTLHVNVLPRKYRSAINLFYHGSLYQCDKETSDVHVRSAAHSLPGYQQGEGSWSDRIWQVRK